MKFMGLDLDDQIVEDYYKYYRRGHRSEKSLRLEILNLLACELKVNGIEEALTVYGKEECETQVHKVLRELIEVTYEPDPVYVLGVRVSGVHIQELSDLCGIDFTKERQDALEGAVKIILHDTLKKETTEEAVAAYGKEFVEDIVNAELSTAIQQAREN